MKDDFVQGILAGVIITIVLSIAIYNFCIVPDARSVAEGTVWAEYTSQGELVWVWKGKK